ncbi:Peroxisomal membrane protein pex16 [Ascosphaera acerosa]|nr:Peroxisomal membrane protein pex16 [Ascosphaera acerosa]
MGIPLRSAAMQERPQQAASAGAAATTLSASATSPQKLVALYEDFITSNSSSVSQVESALRSLTYIIPGRFRESELATESLHSFVHLLSMYHDSLVARAVSRLPSTIARPAPSLHDRYTKHWCARSPAYRRIALCLQLIRHTELLWEMVARRRGEKIRYRVIVALEAVKAVLRFLLMWITNGRAVVDPPLPDREVDPRTVEGDDAEGAAAKAADNEWDIFQGTEINTDMADSDNEPATPTTMSKTSAANTRWHMPRTGQVLPVLPRPSNINAYLLSKVLTADDIKMPGALLRRLTGRAQLAEILHVLRPVVYALALQRWYHHHAARSSRSRSGSSSLWASSWVPWLVGFGLEYACRQLAKRGVRETVAGGMRGLTGLEREELKRRGSDMLWWMLRSGFYAHVTKALLNGVTRRMRGKLVLDLVATIVEDYGYLWDNYYFSTTTM